MTDTPRDPRTADDELELLAPAEEARLATALRLAFAPTELDPARHEQILASAQEDPFAPPSAEEIVESERLRRALDGEGEHPNLILARALAAAHAPKPLQTPARERLEAPLPRARAKVVYVRFGAAFGALAVAALILLSIRAQHASPPTAAPDLQTLAQSRSTAPLFQTASAGPPSARIDRIASVRERELRENRYALWGVR